MSLSEVERFAADLRANEALRKEAKEAQVKESRDTPLAWVVDFAASKGYSFTADEARAHAKAAAAARGRQLTAAELDAIAGGYRLVSDGKGHLIREEDGQKDPRFIIGDPAGLGSSDDW